MAMMPVNKCLHFLNNRGTINPNTKDADRESSIAKWRSQRIGDGESPMCAGKVKITLELKIETAVDLSGSSPLSEQL